MHPGNDGGATDREGPGPEDASGEPDDAAPVDGAQAEDGTVGFDAAPVDAGFDGEVDGGVPCSVDGVPGECLEVSACVGGRAPTPGHCPGPVEFQCCTPTRGDAGASSCVRTDRPEPNVGLVEVVYDDCPPGMIGIETFCIDRYEAFLVEVTAAGEVPWSPYFNPENRTMRARSAAGAVPQGYLNQLQAAAACQVAGKRLCTSAEWLRACQGPNADTYPYGPTRQPGVCNDARAQHPAVEYFGTSAAWIWSELDHPCINQLLNGLATTGAYGGCVSAEGAYDLMGNLHEWIDDPAGTFRGGYYVDTVINGPGCLYRTTAHDVTHFDYSTGFRCCADRCPGFRGTIAGCGGRGSSCCGPSSPARRTRCGSWAPNARR